MLYNICYLAVLFFIYSVLGYILEVTYVSITEKRLAFSRGFLVGPYIPIYAFGAIFMVTFLQKYRDDILVLFIMSCVMCSTLEFFTSYFMEKIFHLRWWDYTECKFNLDGRICLFNSTCFGIAGVLTVKYLNPYLTSLINTFSDTAVIVLGIIFMAIYFVDILVSNFAIFRLKIDTSLFIRKDATNVVKEEVMKSLDKYRFLHRRLFSAFPNILEAEPFKIITESFSKYRYKILKNDLKLKLKSLKKDIKRKK